MAYRAESLALQILANSQFSTTGAAKDRLLVELGAIPDAHVVISLRLMAIKTGIIIPAACELDRDDIKRTPIVSAAGARIYSDTMYRNSRNYDLQAVVFQRWIPASGFIGHIDWLENSAAGFFATGRNNSGAVKRSRMCFIHSRHREVLMSWMINRR